MEHNRLMEEIVPAKETITDWEELIKRLATPARYPRWPELTATGDWRPWSAELNPHTSRTTTVEQPKRVPSRFRRFFSKGRRYCRPIQYQRLSEGHIRLLDLRDARMKDDILTGAKLISVPLSEAPEFEAISYCWGSTDLCTGIFVTTRFYGKQVCRVTENLATCLHSIITSDRPHHKKSSYIWIDQICINQEDVIELNAQVRRMADIYKTAIGVIVWLGQKSDCNVEEVDLKLQPDPELQWRGTSMLRWVLKDTVFARPWFFRQWIVQEAVFAQRITILLGSLFTSWEDLVDLSDSLNDFIAEDFFNEYKFLVTTLNRLTPTVINHAKDDLAVRGFVDLPALLNALYFSQCQDPRDKVFSLVGLADDLFPADFVDYGLPLDTVLQRFTRCLIDATGDLGVIGSSNSDAQNRRPSWVPLWHGIVHRGVGLYARSTCASRHREWMPPSSVTKDQLVTVGKLVDSVAVELTTFRDNMAAVFVHNEGTLGQILRDSYEEAFYHCRNLIVSENDRFLLNRGAASLEYKDRNPSTTFVREFIRAVFCDDEEVSALQRDELFGVLTDDSQDPESNGEALLAKFLRWGQHRDGRLSLLGSGRLVYTNYCSQDIEAGDRIAILHGLDVPCLLRKTADENCWLFIGTVFVDGIMQGEAVDWEEDEGDTFTLV